MKQSDAKAFSLDEVSPMLSTTLESCTIRTEVRCRITLRLSAGVKWRRSKGSLAHFYIAEISAGMRRRHTKEFLKLSAAFDAEAFRLL